MATMVNRKVWWLSAASIKSGVVTKQEFSPHILWIRADSSEEVTRLALLVHLTPQAAIKDARDVADLLLSSANKLEATLDE